MVAAAGGWYVREEAARRRFDDELQGRGLPRMRTLCTGEPGPVAWSMLIGPGRETIL